MTDPMTAATIPAPHVLAIDDDADMRRLIADYLGENELRVTAVATGADMQKVLARDAVDVIVLDLRLAGEDGMQHAKRLRQTSEIPIIIVSGKHDEADRVMGLELGADDYLTKPFSPRELLARIRAVLRRYQTARELLGRSDKRRAYRFAGWELNLGSRRLTSPEGRRVELTNGELNLLQALCAATGADARAAARSVAAERRGGLRPLDRRADPQTAAQDRAEPSPAAVHQDRTRRRLRLQRPGRSAPLRGSSIPFR